MDGSQDYNDVNGQLEIGGKKTPLYLVKGRTITVEGGAIGKGFVYLPYTKSRINFVQTELAVMSSYFTGCVMAKFEMDGKTCVAHVDSEWNNEWIALQQVNRLICEFNPSRYFCLQAPNVPVSAFAKGATDCFGIIDITDKMYAGYMNKKVTKPFYSPGEQVDYNIHTCVPVAQ